MAIVCCLQIPDAQAQYTQRRHLTGADLQARLTEEQKRSARKAKQIEYLKSAAQELAAQEGVDIKDRTQGTLLYHLTQMSAAELEQCAAEMPALKRKGPDGLKVRDVTTAPHDICLATSQSHAFSPSMSIRRCVLGCNKLCVPTHSLVFTRLCCAYDLQVFIMLMQNFEDRNRQILEGKSLQAFRYHPLVIKWCLTLRMKTGQSGNLILLLFSPALLPVLHVQRSIVMSNRAVNNTPHCKLCT